MPPDRTREVPTSKNADLVIRRRGLVSHLERVTRSWAARSLAVGAIATTLDVGVLLACVTFARSSNAAGAMLGVAVGGTFAFFANRHFAFKAHEAPLAPQALRFLMANSGAMLVHGLFVYVLADELAVPVVVAKVIADLAVFSIGQLLVLRYLVFFTGTQGGARKPG